jgi:predicted permease
MGTPGFTAAAVLSLGLGIGANTTIFTWVNAVLLEPLPGVPDAGELAVVQGSDPRQGGLSVSCPDYLDYAATPGVELLAHDELAISFGADGRAERLWGLIVSENYFDALRVRPRLGRGFSEQDRRSKAAVVVISDSLWKRRFAADPGVVGRIVTINTHPFTIVGVSPPDFRGTVVGLAFDAWVPLAAQSLVLPVDRGDARGSRWLQMVARLGPGTSLAQARSALGATARRLSDTYPENRGLGVTVERFWSSRTGGTAALGPVLKVLAVVVVLVLLIACANVASLLVARSTRRRREVAVRLALGASRWRIVRQLLTESALLAAGGGLAGALLALWGSGLLLAFAPRSDLPIALSTVLDARALAFTAALSLATTLVFGLAPALQATRPQVSPTLRDEQASVVGGTRARLRSSLVVTQVALSLLLLVSAGLLARSVRAAMTMHPGFNAKGVLLASVDLHANGYTPESGGRFYADLLERVTALPGVESATLTRRAPLGFGGTSSSTFQVEGFAPAAPEQRPWAFTHVVGPDYFRTLQARVLRGRDFGAGDAGGAPPVAIVDEEAARRYWGDRDPLGSRVHIHGAWRTVVGLAATMKYRTFSEEPGPHVFVPALQVYQPALSLAVRTKADPMALAPAVLTQLRALDAQLPVFGVLPLEEHARAASFQQRMGGAFLSGFGILALALASVGLYGVLAYSVGQRTREIGIRMALGCGRRGVFALVLRHGLMLTAAGMSLGLAGALGATRLLDKLLVGVSPTDTLTFALVPGTLLVVALLACAVPARRATRIDPAVALRYE